MAAYVDQAYYGWPQEELPHQEDSQEVSASQMLDHGSISFGRFAYESLSWERRSVFTVNKCQEELEKFKSPGLVAKKKAYFEEYYKRIRAMKALQDSQQTEITLEYGGDGSISSQTGEEDETSVQLENIGSGVADFVVVHPEETPSGVPIEKGKDCSKAFEVQIAHSDLESKLPDSDSSSNSFELEQEDKTIYPHHMQDLDMNISAHESLTVSIEHEHEDKNIYPHQKQHFDTDISAYESLTISIEEPKQHDLSYHDDKGVSRESSVSVTNIEPEIASEETTSGQTNSRVGEVEFKPDHNMAPIKVMPAVRKCKDSVSVLKLKELPGPAINGLKLEDKTKPNSQKPLPGLKCPIQKTTAVKSGNGVGSSKTAAKSGDGVGSSKTTADKVSRNNKSTSVAGPARNGLKLEDKAKPNSQKPLPGLKCPIQKTTAKSGNDVDSSKTTAKSGNRVGSSKTTADKVSRNNKSTTVASHRPLREVHSNLTVPRPFSLATDRRAAVPSGIRKGAISLISKSSNQSSTIKGKGAMNFEGTSKGTVMSSGLKSRGLENKRGPEEKKKLVTLDNQSTSLTTRGPSVIGPVKARSLNLPPRNKLSSNSGTDSGFKDGIRNDRCDEGKHEARVTEFRRAVAKVSPPSAAKLRTDTKFFTPPSAKLRNTNDFTHLSAKLRTETKKMTQSWIGNSLRRARFGEQSLDGKKPRQEKPRWR